MNIVYNQYINNTLSDLILHNSVNLKLRACHIHVKKTLHTQFLK